MTTPKLVKLDQDIIDFLYATAKASIAVGVESLKLSGGIISGISPDHTTIVIQTDNVPDIGFQLVMHRLDLFTQRMDLIRSDPSKMEVYVEPDPRKGIFVRSMHLRGKGVKIDYRCANPKLIETPASINDKLYTRISHDGSLLTTISKALIAVPSDAVEFVSDGGSVQVTLRDITSDALTMDVECTIEPLARLSTGAFSGAYPAKSLTTLMKQADEHELFFCSPTGSVAVMKNNLMIHLLPLRLLADEAEKSAKSRAVHSDGDD